MFKMYTFNYKNVVIISILLVVYSGAVYSDELSVVDVNGTTKSINVSEKSHITSNVTTVASSINTTTVAPTINTTNVEVAINSTTMVFTTITPISIKPSQTSTTTIIPSTSSVMIPVSMISPIALGNCSCGGFASENVTIDQEPILRFRPEFVVKCNIDGDTVCKNLCVAVASATKAKGPKILCSRVGTADELKLVVFYKTCTDTWMYTGDRSNDPLCCENSIMKQCASTADKNENPKVNMEIEMPLVWH